MFSENKRVKYKYKSVPVPGGGFVTGFQFHPTVKDILYCRTDIGGIYRYDFKNDSWISLIDQATDKDVWETYPLSIALDKNNPSYIYSMVGDYPIHKIGFSDDYGENWTYYNAPVIDDKGNTTEIHGNAQGRSTGERLVVDPENSEVLYMGTMKNGLWKTTDRCKTWTKLNVAGEEGIAFVELNPENSRMVVVSTSGEKTSSDGNTRGQSVYISIDGGETFKPLMGEPKAAIGGCDDHPGYVGQHAVFLEKYLYISYAAYNVGWSNWTSYGCDLGKCSDGALCRFELDNNGEVAGVKEITPQNIINKENAHPKVLDYGISGICADKNHKGTLICSTICASPDTIYRSTDYGETWKPIMSGLEIGKIDFNVSYQQPKYNGDVSLVHWMADLKINPFDSDMALFNTGAGIFMTRNLTDADKDKTVVFACCDKGVEQTVHLNVYCPPAGDVKAIDIIGDYGCFTFTDLDHAAENTFADYKNDRWITAMNADYPDSNPNFIAIAPRGNWLGKTKGGIIVTLDQGKTWQQLNNPVGLTAEIDKEVNYIKSTPNVTAGWTAISADGKRILWSLGLPIYASKLVYTDDMGKAWSQSKVYDNEGKLVSDKEVPFKVMADRFNSDVFYGFSDNKDGKGFYVSTDKGAEFHMVKAPAGFPEEDLAGIDSMEHYEIRVESYKEGVIWIAMQEGGLWRLTYDVKSNTLTGKRVSKEGDFIKRIGLGKAAEGSEYKTLYTSGTINGEYGFYRSHDGGVNWIRINDDKHQYGDIRSISGDLRIFGRLYIATGTRGLVYGDQEQ